MLSPSLKKKGNRRLKKDEDEIRIRVITFWSVVKFRKF